MTNTMRYDSLGQVISGKKFWPDETEVAGQQFGYGFDDIGNRVSTDTNGRPTSYSPNNLNQYTERTVPGAVDVVGSSEPEATVTVNNMATQRKGEYFHKEQSVLNLATAQYPAISVVGVRKNAGPCSTDIMTEETGHAFVPKTPEMFQHDPDGNLIQDGRWVYTWDAENRLVSMEGGAPATPKRLEFAYDHMSRRISKKVYVWDAQSSVFSLQSSVVFVYDGWNLIAELTEARGQMPAIRSHIWGLDLSGSAQGAGGVGGLLFTTTNVPVASTHFAAFDGNGNVSALVDTATGTIAAAYEYDPFGNLIARIENPASSIQNPFLFSTKYFDAESSLYYYGYRYYQPSSGRWLSRDPIEEIGGGNPYAFLSNEPIGQVDFTGLLEVSDTRLHHPIQEWFVKYTDIGRRSYGLRIRLSIDMHVNIDDELTKIRLAYRNGKLSDVQVWNRMVLAHLRIFGPLFRDWWRISRDLGFRSSITFSGGGAAVVATLGGKKVILSKLSTAGGAVIIAGGAVLIYQIQTTKWELQAYAAEIEAENDHFNAVLGAMDRISKRHSDLVTTEVLKKIDCPNRERANDCFSLFARRVKINYVMWEQVKHSIPHVMDIEAREAILEGRFKELMQCLSEQGCCWKP